MRIVVIDAQGGGLGKAIVEKLKEKVNNAEIIALGTNSTATGSMKKAGALQAATGENAIVYNAQRADIIIGGIGIIAANSMLGEITPKMAEAVSSSDALKILIPIGKCHILIPGVQSYTINELIDKAVDLAAEYIENNNRGV